MVITIHRGTHQIGGIATEIRSGNTRIIIDMGNELSLDPNFVPADLNIPGVTDGNGACNAVFFTHYHGDHVGQMIRIRDDVPLYAGALAKDVMLEVAKKRNDDALLEKLQKIQTFKDGKEIQIGDIRIMPYSIDHSACDSYTFLIEANGKRLLYTGDFRTHGFRGKALPKIWRKVGRVDALVTEGTTLSRSNAVPAMSERELQQKVRQSLRDYKYVFVLCASTNLERICALSKAVPRGKYFLCDAYQKRLLDLLTHHWSEYSELYRNLKVVEYGDNIQKKIEARGGLMVVRANRKFEEIIKKFDSEKSIILYSMWSGYLTKPESKIPEFLKLTGQWEKLHTSGHASHEAIKELIEITKPDVVIPMHSEKPEVLKELCPDTKILLPDDGEEVSL